MGREQYRSEPRSCELCGQLVVSVCDSLDMGAAATCHYEPATEDEKAKRIAELEAENAALHSRLEFTSCQKADVEAQVLELEEQIAALRKDAAVGRAIRKWLDKCENNGASVLIRQWIEDCRDGEIRRVCSVDAKSLNRHMFSPDVDNIHAALEAAGLVEEGNRG